MAGFNELQYAYAVNRELESETWLFPPLGIPYFPNLVLEARLGYDVVFRYPVAPVFIQYKISRYLKTKRAKQWETFRRPYFRFQVYPANVSPQHNLLVELAKTEKRVFYVAPTFTSYRDYRKYYINGKVSEESIFLPCNTLPKVVGKEKHYITYTRNAGFAYWCSEPVDIKGIKGINGCVQFCREQDEGFAPLLVVIKRLFSMIKSDDQQYDLDFNEHPILIINNIAHYFMEKYSVALGIINKDDMLYK